MWKKFEQLTKKFLLFNCCRNYPYQEKTVFFTNYSYTVRSAIEDDIKGMIAVERDVYHGKVPWDRLAFLNEFRNLRPHLYLVVERNSQIVAFLGSRIDHSYLHLTNIAVMRKYQHQGIARYLLQEAKRFSIKKRLEQIVLEVNVNNKCAQSFYLRFGFASNHLLKDYYSDSNEDAVKMEYVL